MRSIQARLLCVLLVIGLPLVLLSACGGGGGSGDSGTSSSTGTNSAADAVTSTGSVSVSLTDNQTLYNAVVLTIVEVGIVASNIETTYYNSTDLGELPLTVNVLDFPEEATLHLGDIEFDLPENGDPVCFNQIRMVLAAEGDEVCDGLPHCNFVIEKGDDTPYMLKTPSGQQSGVKILTPEDFCVDENADSVQVTIDFDPSKAIVHNENNPKNKYILKPTGIRIIEGEWGVSPEGYIAGLVAAPVPALNESCEKVETPLVKIAAYYSADRDNLDAVPASFTVALADDPVTKIEADEFCAQVCSDDEVDIDACEIECSDDLLSQCYFTGPYKLLLPTKDTYDLEAAWSKASAEAFDVAYNSTVFLKLTFDE